MKPALKHFAESTLIASGVERLARARLRRRTIVLAYHNILPEGEARSGDASLHLGQRSFSKQLDALLASHEVISITDLFRDSVSRRPRVVITFDDAYAGSLTAGVEELARRGLPATVFIAPALVGGVTWWDTLADSESGSIRENVRNYSLDELQGSTERVLDWASGQSKRANPPNALPHIGTLSEMMQAASCPGITFGSHTWSHRNLCRLSDAEIRLEMSRPLEWMRARFSNVVSWVSYPYGFFNDASRKIAAETGYVGAMRIDGGWVPQDGESDPYRIPRFNVPSGLSLNGFRLRVAGL